VDDALLAIEQQRSARHQLKNARQLPLPSTSGPSRNVRIKGAAQMRRQPLQPLTILLRHDPRPRAEKPKPNPPTPPLRAMHDG